MLYLYLLIIFKSKSNINQNPLMKNPSLQVLKPLYTNRNEKKQFEKQIKRRHEQQNKTEPIYRTRRQVNQDKLSPSRQIKTDATKQFLLVLLSDSKEKWQKQLLNKKELINSMKQQHRMNLQKILKQIEQIRKKAYLQFRHICNKQAKGQCLSCLKHQNLLRKNIKAYLETEPGKYQKTQKQETGQQQKSKKYSVSKQMVNKSTRSSYRLTNSPRMSLNQYSNSISDENDLEAHLLQQGKVINSKTSIKRKSEIQKLVGEAKRNNDHNNFKSDKRKSGQIKKNAVNHIMSQKKKSICKDSINFEFKTEIIEESDDSGNKGNQQIISRSNSRHKVRKSILQLATSNSSSAKQRSNFWQAPNAQQSEGQSAVTNQIDLACTDYKKNSPYKNQSSEQTADKDGCQVPKKLTNKYIKKLNSLDDDVIIDMGWLNQSEQDDDGMNTKRQQEVEELLKQRQHFKEEAMLKLSRYRRERLFYDLLKQEIMRNELSEVDLDDQQRQFKLNQTLSATQRGGEFDHLRFTQTNLHSNQPHSNQEPMYSLNERKESLISKLKVFNQHTDFDHLRQCIQAKFTSKSRFMETRIANSMQQTANKDKMDEKSHIKIIERFLAQVLKTGDLKRLLKQKFAKESDWSNKMREMHQFYTFLEYSVQSFRSKLKKTIENSWSIMAAEGKDLNSVVDQLVLSDNSGHYEGVSNLGQQEDNHQIECSMKYYGINVKRVEDNHRFYYDLPIVTPVARTINVLQKSMKNIKQVYNAFQDQKGCGYELENSDKYELQMRGFFDQQ